MLDPRRVAGLGLVVLVTAVLAGSLTSAAEPGLSDLNGHSFWKQFENGFRGLEQAALSQATRLQHALQQAMHLGKQPAEDKAQPEAAPQQDDDSSDSTGMEEVGVHGHLFPSLADDREDRDDKSEAEDSSSEEDDDSDPEIAGFPGPIMFPNFFGDPFSVVWWKGPNVCVAREEIDETPNRPGRRQDGDANLSASQEDSSSASPEDHHGAHPLLEFMGPPMFSNFHFSSCSQTHTKYQCVTRSVNHGVHKKLVTTHRCCHGARREAGKPGCTMVNMSSVLDTARDMGGELFAKMLTSSGLESLVSREDANTTLFVPTDDAMRDFMENIQDQNRVRRALGPRPLTPVLVADEESAPSPPVRVPARGEPLPKPLAVQVDLEQSDVAPKSSPAAAPPAPEQPRGDELVPEAARREGRLEKDSKDPLGAELVDLEDRLLVLAHRVDALVDLHEARNDAILDTTANTTIRLNVYAGPMGRTVTANCARVTKDRPARGGLVHQVDKVLRPVPRDRTLATIIEKDPRLSTMRALLRVSDMMDALNQPGPLTVFFPTDEAFKQMDPEIRTELLKGEACVASFIRNMMVKHTVCTAAAALRLRAPNLDGEFLMLERMASDDGKLTLEDAELGQHDIMASNGVLHLLNKVILPDSARTVKDALKAKNLTRWYDLLQQADLLYELDHAKNITMFVPTEAALRTPEAELLLSGDDKEALRQVLRYHIARPMLEADDMSNGQNLDTTLDGKHLRINLYSTIPFLSAAVTSATVQCGRLESVNSKACGAVLHEVDRVLAPPTQSVLELLQRDQFSILLDIVKASSYAEYLSSAKEFPPFTLLAPTNAGFDENVSAERLDQLKSDKRHADAFLQRHILPSSLCCSGVGVTSWPFTNRATTLKEGVSHRIRKDTHNRVRIGDAVVQQCDKIATNGIMHVIDTPLIPSKGLPPTPLNNRRRNSNLEILLFGL